MNSQTGFCAGKLQVSVRRSVVAEDGDRCVLWIVAVEKKVSFAVNFFTDFSSVVKSEQRNCQLHPLTFVGAVCSRRGSNHGRFQMTLIKSQYMLWLYAT